MTETQLLTVNEAARLMERSKTHVCTLARQGHLDAQKRGKFWFIEPASIERYMQETAAKQMPAILDDPEELAEVYRQTGTLRALALEIGCSHATVRLALRRHGITIPTRRQVARKQAAPEPVDLKRWMDVAIIYYKRGLPEAGICPPRPEEMCPVHCEGRDWCLDGGECVMAGDSHWTKGENND